MAVFKDWIVCSGAPGPGEVNAAGQALPLCDWGALITLVQVLIYNMVVLSTFLAIAVFGWIGFLFLTSGGNSGAKDKAKKMFLSVMKGYLWILFAWLVIYTITNTLLKPGYTLLTP